MTVRLAWALTALTGVAVVADMVVTAQYRNLLSEDVVAVHGFPFVDLAVLGGAALGALILGRDDRHPVGLLLVLIGFTGGLSLLTEAYSVWLIEEDGPGSRAAAGVTGWSSSLLGGQLSIAAIALMFLLAPDGRLLSRRWRWAAAVTVLGALLCAVSVLIQKPVHYDISATAEAYGPTVTVLASAGFVLISAGMLASVASMVVRLRRSTGEARQQVRLIALAAALVAAGLVNLAVVQGYNGGQQTWAASMPLFLSYDLFIALFGVAVLRYRLYDVEVILNRTLVLVLGAAFAALGYTTLVVLVGRLVDSRTGDQVLSLSATALVALAFQPLRRQVVRLANRLAYGSRAQPYEALSDFSRRTAGTPTPQTLLPAVAEAARQAVSARGARAVLRAPGAPVTSADVGTCGADDAAQSIDVVHGQELLGSMRVWLPGGAGLRPGDVRLLEALADQAAVVFRNVALEALLEVHVADLDRTTHDLARSRVRIIEADDRARRTMEAAISRDVLPHLSAVSAGVRRARVANDTGSDTGLDDLVARTNTALESLRELTRGLFPAQLARAGIDPALRSLLARTGLAGALRVDRSCAGRRFSPGAEAAVYSCCVAAVRELRQVTSLELSLVTGELVLVVRGTRRAAGDEVQGILDRAEAVGGSVTATRGGLVVRIPVDEGMPASAGGVVPDL